MRVSARAVLRVMVLGLVMALAVPAIALGQDVQNGNPGNGGTNSGSNSGQTNSQNAAGNGNTQQSIQQQCTAGRDCANIANQNSTTGRTFEREAPAVRRERVRRVRLAFTGFDLTPLFAIGGLSAAGGLALLGVRRRRLSSLS